MTLKNLDGLTGHVKAMVSSVTLLQHMNVIHIPFTGTMNSMNWPAPNVWVFIAQLVEYCSANAEAMGSNPVKAPKTFFGLTLRLLKSQS